MKAEKVAYRFEDRRYSVADEWGDHHYTSYETKLLVFPVLKLTPKGYWIGLAYQYFPRIPNMPGTEFLDIDGRRFVNLTANKRFALPTVEEARESYLKRKLRQISIYEARVSAAKYHIEAMNAFMRDHSKEFFSQEEKAP